MMGSPLWTFQGMGYAKVSKSIRAQWAPMVDRYLAVRKNLMGVILLIDIRRDPGKEEFELMDWFCKAPHSLFNGVDQGRQAVPDQTAENGWQF